MFFIAYTFKGQVHDIVFAGQVKIVSQSSCKTSTLLKYFCPLLHECSYFIEFIEPAESDNKCLPNILSFFLNQFNKFNNTGARVLDSIYHMTLR